MKKDIVNISVFILALVLILSGGSIVFADDLLLPSSLTTIEAEAFMGDTSLDNVIIPSGVTAIMDRTFADSSLRSIHIPASVRSVAADAFAGTDPVIYVEDINSLSGNLTGTIRLIQDSTISSPLSYSDATLIVEDGVTLTVTDTLEGSDLEIYGTVINLGSVTINGEVTTYGSGLFSVPDVNTYTEIPGTGFYGGLHFSLAESVQVHVTSENNTQTVTAIGTGSHTAEITTGGQIVRFCFVPAASGSYTITSSESGDTYVQLSDASGAQITSADEGGEGDNFELTYYLTADTVYFYDVRYSSGDNTGDILFTLTSASETSTEIISHPIHTAAMNNEEVNFSVTASGTGLTYQWQILLPGENTDWEDMVLSGYNTNTLSFPAQRFFDNCQFRCSVTGSDGIPVYSEAAYFYFFDGVLQMGENTAEISAHSRIVSLRFTPAISGNYSLISTGENDPFVSLKITGDEGWTVLTSDDDSGEDFNFHITYELEAGADYYFDVAFYDDEDSVTIPMSLYYDDSPIITQHPLSVVTTDGTSVSFSVTATGIDTLTYQWQELESGSSSWQNSSRSGNQTETISLTAQSSLNGRQFRCIITDGIGFTAVSRQAALYIQSPDDPVYRALFIPEVNFEGDDARPGHQASVDLLTKMLRTVTGPDGGHYMIYGADYEYEDASPLEILDAISAVFGGAKDNDVSLIYIASHGVEEAEGEQAGAIGTVRASKNHRYTLPSGFYYPIPNSLFIDELAQALKAIAGKVIIWIDTCGSGAGIYDEDISSDSYEEDFDSEWFNRNVIRAFADADEETQEISDLTGELRVEGKFYVLTSSAHRESSWGSDNGTFFAHGISNAISISGGMPADDDHQDGIVTLQELYNYTYAEVMKMSEDQEEQHVQVYPENSAHELFSR